MENPRALYLLATCRSQKELYLCLFSYEAYEATPFTVTIESPIAPLVAISRAFTETPIKSPPAPVISFASMIRHRLCDIRVL